MSLKACTCLLAVVLTLALAASAVRSTAWATQDGAAVRPPASLQLETDVWGVLHRFETDAIRDYEMHRSTSDVRQRGQILMQVAMIPAFRKLSATCGRAAQLLSFMITGYYEARQRGEIALDWHHFSKPYVAARTACLEKLGYAPGDFRLPWRFGR